MLRESGCWLCGVCEEWRRQQAGRAGWLPAPPWVLPGRLQPLPVHSPLLPRHQHRRRSIGGNAWRQAIKRQSPAHQAHSDDAAVTLRCAIRAISMPQMCAASMEKACFETSRPQMLSGRCGRSTCLQVLVYWVAAAGGRRWVNHKGGGCVQRRKLLAARLSGPRSCCRSAAAARRRPARAPGSVAALFLPFVEQTGHCDSSEQQLRKQGRWPRQEPALTGLRHPYVDHRGPRRAGWRNDERLD